MRIKTTRQAERLRFVAEKRIYARYLEDLVARGRVWRDEAQHLFDRPDKEDES